jgi:hypothetical protein
MNKNEKSVRINSQPIESQENRSAGPPAKTPHKLGIFFSIFLETPSFY